MKGWQSDSQKEARIFSYVKKNIRAEKRHAEHKINKMHERKQLREAFAQQDAPRMGSRGKSPGKPASKTSRVPPRPKTARSSREDKTHLGRYRFNLHRRLESALKTDSKQAISSARKLMRKTGDAAMLSDSVQFAVMERELKELTTKVKSTGGPGYYNVGGVKAGRERQAMIARNENLAKVPLYLRAENPRTVGSQMRRPGPADYETGHWRKRNAPKWSMSGSNPRAQSLNVRRVMEAKLRAAKVMTLEKKNMIVFNRERQKRFGLDSAARKMERQQLREWRRRLVEIRRRNLEQARLERAQEAIYKASPEYRQLVRERVKRRAREQVRVGRWMAAIKMVKAVKYMKKRIVELRKQVWKRKILRLVFTGPWQDLTKDKGMDKTESMLRQYVFKLSLNHWMEQRILKKRKSMRVIVDMLRMYKHNRIREKLSETMVVLGSKVRILQRVFRSRRRVNKWRLVIVASQIAKLKWQEFCQNDPRPRTARQRFHEMYNTVVPKLDKESLIDMAQEIYEKRLHEFNLASFNHRLYCEAKLSNTLRGVFGVAARDVSGHTFSRVDFEITCEMLDEKFTEAKAGKVWPLIDKFSKGRIKFARIEQFYKERLNYHIDVKPPTEVIDPVDGVIKKLAVNAGFPVFRLSFDHVLQDEVKRRVKLRHDLSRRATQRKLKFYKAEFARLKIETQKSVRRHVTKLMRRGSLHFLGSVQDISDRVNSPLLQGSPSGFGSGKTRLLGKQKNDRKGMPAIRRQRTVAHRRSKTHNVASLVRKIASQSGKVRRHSSIRPKKHKKRGNLLSKPKTPGSKRA